MKLISYVLGAIISVIVVSYFIFNKEQHPYYQLGAKMCSCTSMLTQLNSDYSTEEVRDSLLQLNPKLQSEYKKCLFEFYDLGVKLQLDSNRYYGVEDRIIPMSEMESNYIRGFEENGCELPKTIFELE